MTYSATHRPYYAHKHTHSSKCQLSNQLKSSCINECRGDHITTSIDFVWGRLHDGWITPHILMNRLPSKTAALHLFNWHLHTDGFVKHEWCNGDPSIHPFKHGLGWAQGARSGSQHGADRRFSLFLPGQTGLTPVRSSQTLLETRPLHEDTTELAMRRSTCCTSETLLAVIDVLPAGCYLQFLLL